MSDERDDVEPARDGDEDTSTGQSAVVNRPARPSGKRSRQRAGGTALAEIDDSEEALTEQFEAADGTALKKAKGATAGSTRNPVLFVWNYMKQVVAELRKVIWPNRKQMVNYTLVVLVFLVFMTALISGVDLGLAKLVLKVFG